MHCQNICDGGIPPGERGIGSSTKEPSSLSNKLVQWVSTEEELKSPRAREYPAIVVLTRETWRGMYSFHSHFSSYL